MKQRALLLGQILYAITFVLLIPAGLWLWAKYTSGFIPSPVVQSDTIGWILIITGIILMLVSMYALKKIGKGLPMNAYPPTQYVTSGPYRIFRHPIYWGFGILLIGFFILTGSASGLWLVTPSAILGMIAIVKGYEELDLNERFPGQKLKTVFDLPEKNESTPSIGDSMASLLRVFILLVLSNYLLILFSENIPPLLGNPLALFTGSLHSNFIFLSVLFIALTPFLIKTNTQLREWAVSATIGISISTLAGVLYPAIGASYLPISGLPLYSVPLYLIFISLNSIFIQSVKLGIIFTFVVSILAFIALSISRSAELHLAISTIIFLLSLQPLKIWIFLKNTSEKIANSWQEWTFGNIRIINHGIYPAAGAFFGVLMAGILAGKAYAFALLFLSFVITIFGALWAQVIEGSDKLKRPFGYYGGLVGILFGTLALNAMGYNSWVILGVIAVFLPWAQAMGRLRCLVNGCCHGKPVDNPLIGIRFFHPRSRVCTISGLKGEYIHPTQLYSILWLFLVGLILFALWQQGFSAPFIFGLYLILTSFGRFVEEAYRGEAQTPIIYGLRLYQWTAILSLIVGILMTTISVTPGYIDPGFNWPSVFAATASGLFTFFAMGVDFPNSNARFSRLV